MQYTLPILALMGLVSTTFAAPTPDAAAPRKFHLRVKTINPDSNTYHTSFNGSYVSTYHTGAGLNSAVLTPGPPTDLPLAFLNNTRLNFLLQGNPASYGYQLNLSPADSYVYWGNAFINVGGEGSDGFYYDATTQAIEYKPEGASEATTFRACDWNYDVPELFFDTGRQASGKFFVPANCKLIKLVPEYV